MATTLVPPTAAPKPVSGDVRFVSVRAHLLPDEVISARQVDVRRKQVLIGLAVVGVLLIGWFGLSKWQTSSANSDLHTAQRHGVELQSQQNKFGTLVQAQASIQSIQGQLAALMTGDLSWKTMLTTLRAKAPDGVAINSVDGTVTSGAAAGTAGGAAGAAILNQTGSPAVGELTVSGTAPDKRAVAAYADSLGTVTGLTAPLISSVTAEEKDVKFTISAVITSSALGGRYVSQTPGQTGSK